MNDIQGLFENKPLYKERPQKPRYDVVITLNRRGDNKYKIRFGFYNEASEVFKGFNYMQVSQIEKTKDRIYFNPKQEKQFADDYKLIPKSERILYLAFTPKENTLNLYRETWVGVCTHIRYDEKLKLYYVEKEKS